MQYSGGGTLIGSCQIHGCITPLSQQGPDSLAATPSYNEHTSDIKEQILTNRCFLHTKCKSKVHRCSFCVRFIAEHTKLQEDSTKVFCFYRIWTYSCYHMHLYFRSRKTGNMWLWF